MTMKVNKLFGVSLVSLTVTTFYSQLFIPGLNSRPGAMDILLMICNRQNSCRTPTTV